MFSAKKILREGIVSITRHSTWGDTIYWRVETKEGNVAVLRSDTVVDLLEGLRRHDDD